MTDEEIEKKIDDYAKISLKFKIGETGQPIDKRFNGEHESEYADIANIYSSFSKVKIDNIEAKMIAKFMAKYPETCKNEKGGSAGDMGMSKEYSLYVVYTKRHSYVPIKKLNY